MSINTLKNCIDLCENLKSTKLNDLSESHLQNDPISKKGTSGEIVNLTTNYFLIPRPVKWSFYRYLVIFAPEEIEMNNRKKLMASLHSQLGPNIFDGSNLYLPNKYSKQVLEITLKNSDNELRKITIKFIEELMPGDSRIVQFYNLILRNCLKMLKLEQIGRNFFNVTNVTSLHQHKLQIFLGFKTSIKMHEGNFLLGADVIHKIMREETALDLINRKRESSCNDKEIKEALLGNIVQTRYNGKTYKVDDIDFSLTPCDVFEYKRRKMSYLDYYKTHYGIKILSKDQPLLVSRCKKTINSQRMLYLIPELCLLSGLNEEEEKDVNLMRTLGTHFHLSPKDRTQALVSFMNDMRSSSEVQEKLEEYDLSFSSELLKIKGRVLNREKLLFNANEEFEVNDVANWHMAFKLKKKMFSTVPLKTWAVVVPLRFEVEFLKALQTLIHSASSLGFSINQPMKIEAIKDVRSSSYLKKIENLVKTPNLQLLFFVLATNDQNTYSAIKRHCLVNYAIPCQCYLGKNLRHRSLLIIMSKLAVQLNVKLGGEPWRLRSYFSSGMIIGYDAFHCGKRLGMSVGALVATRNEAFTKFSSTISYHKNKSELCTFLSLGIKKSLDAFYSTNQFYPSRIIFYRDGVGEGYLYYVQKTELIQIQTFLQDFYNEKKLPKPKFTFIVVNKRILTRFFENNLNPRPGTIVDDVITNPGKFDFFLVSHEPKQGTVSPTSYNVIHDEQGVKADEIQKLTYRLTHLYFNWSGATSVPAVVHYAHKLAYLAGTSFNSLETYDLNLQQTLFFL